jgi:hypothetical protein
MRVRNALLGAGVVLCAFSAQARTTIGVGTCNPKIVNFSTIGAAVTAAPSGAVIQVCPGPYPEQVVITKPLTLEGVTFGNSSAAHITVPAGGIVANAAYLAGGTVAAQILVQNAAAVTISNLIVDGSGNGIAGCAPDIIGIYYQNASGNILNNALVNQALGSGLGGCQAGEGIFVESNSAGSALNTLIQNNTVSNFQKNGITATNVANGNGVTSAIINANTVLGQGPTPAIAANAIQVSYGAGGSITTNVVGNNVYTGPIYGASGILVYLSPGIKITGNTVTASQYPIAVVGDGVSPDDGYGDNATITTNKIGGTVDFDSIDLCSSSNDTVTSNTVNGAGSSGVHVDSSCGIPSINDTVASNKIYDACAGILVGPGSATPSGTNTVANSTSQVLTQSDVCPAVAGAVSRPGLARLRVSPLRR